MSRNLVYASVAKDNSIDVLRLDPIAARSVILVQRSGAEYWHYYDSDALHVVGQVYPDAPVNGVAGIFDLDDWVQRQRLASFVSSRAKSRPAVV